MKKLLFILVAICAVYSGSAQNWATSGTKTRFTKGLGIPVVTDTLPGTPADTAQIIMLSPDSTIYYKYKGFWRPFMFKGAGDLVPYFGANSRVDLGAYRMKADAYDLAIPGVSADSIGRMRWNADDITINIGLTPNVTLQTGQEVLTLVKNQTGALIPNGTIVRQSGVVGASGRLKIEPFLANGTHNSNQVLGVTTEDIPDGADGFVTSFGKVRQLNTAAWPDSTILYASPTVAGGFTSTVPEAPNNIVKIGTVINSSASNGILFVRVIPGSNIHQDEGVQLINPVDKSLLVYDSASTLWKNGTLASVGGIRVQDTAAMLAPFVQYTDTASMLTPYTRMGNTFNGSNQLLKLDAGGKVPFTSLPSTLMIYKGTWDANNNAPTLSDGQGISGWVYRVSAGGTQNLGSGSITFYAGDDVVYNGTTWEVSRSGNNVVSVNGQQGVVTLTTTNIGEGTNLYYTDARARAAFSAGTGISLASGVITNTAPDQTVSLTNGGNITITGTYPNFTLTNGITNNNQLTNGAGYITGNQTITLSGDVTGSGTTSITTAIGAGKVTNAMLAGSIDYAKMNAATVPTWNQNTTGNAATATTATGWSGNTYAGGAYASAPTFVLGFDGTNWRSTTAAGIQSFLNLSSYAYRSSGLAELSGATFTGGISGTSANFGGRIFTTNDADYGSLLSTNGALVMSFDPTGQVGYLTSYNYTTSTAKPLTINSSSVSLLGSLSGTTASFSGGVNMATSSGSVGIGTTSPTEKLTVVGNINLAYTTSSPTINYLKLGTYAGGIYGSYIGAYSNYASTLDTDLRLGVSNGGTALDALVILSTGAATFSSSVTANGNAATTSAFTALNGTGSSGTTQRYIEFGTGGTVIGRILRGNGASGYTDNGLNIDNFAGFRVNLNALGGSGGTFEVSGGAATFKRSLAGVGLQVESTDTYGQIRVQSAGTNQDAYLTLNASGTGKGVIQINDNNRVTISSTGEMVVTSSVTATAFYESSDLRQKTVHTTLKSSDGIDAIQYTFKPTNSEKWGYGAQQVQPILPYAVSKGEDGFFKVDYTTVHTYKIAQLEKRIAKLEKQLKK